MKQHFKGNLAAQVEAAFGKYPVIPSQDHDNGKNYTLYPTLLINPAIWG
ncbi:MAG: hypothetical protein ACK417_00045 [Bacteroidia bacterium]